MDFKSTIDPSKKKYLFFQENGYGDLAVCVNNKNWRQYCIQPPCGQLNPANAALYRVLKDLYADLAELLPRPALFHMGGDEVGESLI